MEVMDAGERETRRAVVDGLDALGDAELLGLLWRPDGGGRDDRARQLLDVAELAELRNARVGELVGRWGLDRARAVRLAAALQLGARSVVPVPSARVRLAHPSDVAAVMAPLMAGLPRERVVVLVLDRSCRLMSRHVVAEGWREGAPVDPREVFRPAVVERGHAVVLVHNHPSGNPEPSAEDRELTRRLVEAGRMLGIRVVDHVVVAAGGWGSACPGGCA